MKNSKFIILILSLLALALLMIIILNFNFFNSNQSLIALNKLSSTTPGQSITIEKIVSTSTPLNLTPASSFVEPLNSALKRVTKKPFGLYVSPGHSPVSPEKFTGYHTGVDFEILPGEENTDVPIYAVCNGTILEKRTASGYGGIVVQACQLNGQDITVIYGHLKLTSIVQNVNQKLTAGEKIGILGKANSAETGGERKHLHLGIHKGTAINILGYVQNPELLTNWLDFTKYLKN